MAINTRRPLKAFVTFKKNNFFLLLLFSVTLLHYSATCIPAHCTHTLTDLHHVIAASVPASFAALSTV